MTKPEGWLIPAFLGGLTCMILMVIASFISCYRIDTPMLTVRNESGSEITVTSHISDFDPETIIIQSGATTDVSPNALEHASHIDKRSLSFLVQSKGRTTSLDVSGTVLTRLYEANFVLTVLYDGVQFMPSSSAPTE